MRQVKTLKPGFMHMADNYYTGGSAPTTISSTTVVHDQIFLTDSDGTEYTFQLQDFNVACREGNELTVIWSIKRGAQKGLRIVLWLIIPPGMLF